MNLMTPDRETHEGNVEFKEEEAMLRTLAEQCIALAAGNFRQALNAMLHEVKKKPRLTSALVRIGAQQVLRNAQSAMRNSDIVVNMSRFERSQPRVVAAEVNPLEEQDLKRLVGRFRVPLHKSGIWIGRATEAMLLESIQEIDRNLDGLNSTKNFEEAVLQRLKAKRTSPGDRVMDVMTEKDVDRLFRRLKLNRAIA